ncbi:MAG: ferric reductase-like transmembrane domain-containing protein [Pseudomonadota bacterium]
MPPLRSLLIWLGVAALAVIPLIAAAQSPLLQWREPVYIAAGFAGVLGMVLILLQPLLAARLLPGISGATSRRIHRLSGATLVIAILLHVAGLWITSPPDVIDALTFTSPTPFAPWGVIAMWAAFAAAGLALLRQRIGPRIWRAAHTGLVTVVVLGTVIHALLIDGTMETVSKGTLALACLTGLGVAIHRMRAWTLLRKRRPHA